MNINELKPLNESGKPVGEIYYKGKVPYRIYKSTCPRCSGRGIIIARVENGKAVPVTPDAGLCWQCYGAREIQEERKLYTPKQLESYRKRQETLETKRAEEARAKAQARREKEEAELLQPMFIIDIEDTWSIKDEVRGHGATWNNFLRRWVFENQAPENYKYPLIQSCLKEMKDEEGRLDWKKIQSILDGNKKVSEYYGNKNDKIELNVIYANRYSYDTDYGYMYIHKFIDSEGHAFVWNTKADFDDSINIGDALMLKGTIKDHTEYRTEKQTMLIRCKAVKVEG